MLKQLYKEKIIKTTDEKIVKQFKNASEIVSGADLFTIKKRGNTYTITANDILYKYGEYLIFENDLDIPISVCQNCLLDSFGVAWVKDQLNEDNTIYTNLLKNEKALAIVHLKSFVWGENKKGKWDKLELKNNARLNWLSLYKGEELKKELEKRAFDNIDQIVEFVKYNVWQFTQETYKKSEVKSFEN